MEQAFKYLATFLPVQLFPQDHIHGHKLWLEEFMKLWETYHNAPLWVNSMMSLVARLSFYNIGYIDWEPYMPMMFTRFMRSLNLPVLYKKTGGVKSPRMGMPAAAEWIVSCLGNGSNAQIHLEKFLQAIETYLHQANFGPWVEKLKDLLTKLTQEFVLRLRHERYGKKTWLLPIPDSHKLTDADVDAFVKCVMPVAMTAMFGNTSIVTTCKVLRLLATVRPNMVIPLVIERLYSTLDSLTEPHKLTAAMMAVTSVARPMAQGKRNINTAYVYNEGPSRIISLLFAALPGIDANDIKKSYVTFRLIFVYAMVVPIVDSSKTTTSDLLDEDEKIVVEETSQFEDFVLQFFDRIFSLVESSTLEYVSHENQDSGSDKSKVETLVEHSLMSICTVLLLRTSNDIFRSALHKLRSFVTDRVLETRVSGPLAGALCHAFARVNGYETLRALLPIVTQNILDVLEEVDIDKEETIDDRLLYPMLLLANIVDTQGNNLMPYMDTLINILDKILHLKPRKGVQKASRILGNIVKSLSNVARTHDFTCNGRDHNDPDYPYVLDWGQGVDINTININWYVPGEEEIAMMQHIFTRFIPPEIVKIQDYCQNNNTEITRHELLTSLTIISVVIDGAGDLLPLPDNNKNDTWNMPITVGIKGEIKMPDGTNVREYLVKIMSELQSVMLKNSEDDTKSSFTLLGIWNVLLLGKSRSAERHKRQWISWKQIKAELNDELVKKKKILPECFVERVELQHQLRIYSRYFNLTDYHKFIMFQLFQMATSTYAKVRMIAQDAIHGALPFFSYSRTIFKDHLVELLSKDPEEYHEAHKGLLYLLLGPFGNALIVSGREWPYLRSLYPAIVSSKPSEKMSVIRLKDHLCLTINRSLSTIPIKLHVPESCVTVAAELWNGTAKPTLARPTDTEINEGRLQLEYQQRENIETYNNLLDDLLNAIETSSHWRQRAMGIKIIMNLAHLDQPYPPKVVNYFLGALIHDSLEERKIATVTAVCMLAQQKRKHPKIEINIPERQQRSVIDGLTIWTDDNLKPGIRKDNIWLQYNYKTRPLTAEQWDEQRYIHEPRAGYYTWPEKVEVYAPSTMQPTFDLDKRIYTESEKLVDIFFSDPQNIEKLIKYNSLEERKGKDKFTIPKFLLYKGLFRNHGLRHLDLFIPHLKTLVVQKVESSQRCAAEIIAGIIRGSKHWNFSMVTKLWEELIPIIRLALDNVTTETIRDWGLCFASALSRRDPNRHHWLLECLMEEPEMDNETTSFLECQRLYILHTALAQQSWRISELMNRLLTRIEKKLLANPFQNVRNTLASLLMIIHAADYNAGTVRSSYPTPRAEDLMDRLLPRLLKLQDDNNDIQNNTTEETTLARAIDISVLKITCKWVVNSILVMPCGMVPRSIALLPILCQLESCETDDELRKMCTYALASLSEALTLPRNVDLVMDAINDISNASSWSTRASCLCFIEAFVFHNMGIIVSNSIWVQRIQEIVLRLLADERLEVREKAGQVLCGLLHCAFLPEQDALLNEFKCKSKKKIKTPDDLRLRYAGVLGLCAFIRAHPYDVPKYVPSIFEYLNLRLNDPQPVPVIILIVFYCYKCNCQYLIFKKKNIYFVFFFRRP